MQTRTIYSKLTFLFILVSTLALSSCKKEDPSDNPTNNPYADIVGTWVRDIESAKGVEIKKETFIFAANGTGGSRNVLYADQSQKKFTMTEWSISSSTLSFKGIWSNNSTVQSYATTFRLTGSKLFLTADGYEYIYLKQ